MWGMNVAPLLLCSHILRSSSSLTHWAAFASSRVEIGEREQQVCHPFYSKNQLLGTSLADQWLRLPGPGAPFPSLVRELRNSGGVPSLARVPRLVMQHALWYSQKEY